MKFDLDQASIKLSKASHLRLPEAAGATVAVLWGAVWLTQEGDSRDYELHAGESLVIRSRGVTLATALADTALTVLEPIQDPRAPDGMSSQIEPRRYITAAEFQRFAERARQLRARYIGFLVARVRRGVANYLLRLRERTIGSWANSARRSWASAQDRLTFP